MPQREYNREAFCSSINTAKIVQTYAYKNRRHKMLKEKIENYLRWSGISKTLFCKRNNISLSTLYKFLSGELNISDELQQRLTEYLDKYTN